MLKHIFSLGMFLWLVILAGLGYGIGFLFGHPLIGMGIGIGLLVLGIGLSVLVGYLMVMGTIKMFDSLSGRR